MVCFRGPYFQLNFRAGNFSRMAPFKESSGLKINESSAALEWKKNSTEPYTELCKFKWRKKYLFMVAIKQWRTLFFSLSELPSFVDWISVFSAHPEIFIPFSFRRPIRAFPQGTEKSLLRNGANFQPRLVFLFRVPMRKIVTYLPDRDFFLWATFFPPAIRFIPEMHA